MRETRFSLLQVGLASILISIVNLSVGEEIEISKDSTAKDSSTGLIWGHANCQSSLTFVAAQRYCENIKVDGEKWCLPTKEQLQTAFRTEKTNEKNFRLTEIFNLNRCRYLWSSSKQVSPFKNSWLSFLYGNDEVWTFNPETGKGFFATEKGSMGMGALCVNSC